MTMEEEPPASGPSVVHKPPSRLPGDPYALLEPYQTPDPLEDWDIKYRFAQLRIRLSRCVSGRLALRANGINGVGGLEEKTIKCNLCKATLFSALGALVHCLTDQHVDEMNGAVCGDAFMFWWRVVQEASVEDLQSIIMTPVPRLDPFPKVCVPPGVDPFALLQSCERARRKMPANEIAVRFPELRARFDICDRKRLVKQTDVVYGRTKFKECSLCEVDVSFSTMIEHVSSWMHMKAMDGVVCADAFDFWWNAVEAAIAEDRLKMLPFEPESVRWPEPANRVKLTPFPRPGVDPSALLRSCKRAGRKMPTADISTKFNQLQLALEGCDKKQLCSIAKAVLHGNLSCTLCNAKVDHYDAIDHFCAEEHIDRMKGAVCADAFDFWWNAVEGTTVVPKISPLPDVDPFALLKSCHTRFPLMSKSAIDSRFKQLRVLFDWCDKDELARQTSLLFEKLAHSGVKGCILCCNYVNSVEEMIIHICDPDHIEKLNGDVCYQSFNFWWNAVESVTIVRPELETILSRKAVPVQFSPTPHVNPFALLRSCDKRRPLMNKPDIKGRFEELSIRYDWCDKKKLEQQTSSLFKKLRRSGVKGCALCKKYVTSIDDMIIHICDPDHIQKMEGQVCLHAFNFWWKAVEAVTDLEPERDPPAIFKKRKGKKTAIVQKPQPKIKEKPAIEKKPEPEIQKKPEIGKKSEPKIQKKPAVGKKPEPEIQKKPAVGKKAKPAKSKQPQRLSSRIAVPWESYRVEIMGDD